MALTKEQFVELRKKGLTVDQIVKFDKQQTSKPVQKQKLRRPEPGLLQKADKLAQNTFGKASDFLFGSTSKAVGGLISSTIGEGANLVADVTKNSRTREFAQKMTKQGDEEITPINIAFTALETFPGGGVLTSKLRKIPGGDKIAEGMSSFIKKLPETLRVQAIDQYKQVLGATTNKFKDISDKIAPQLAKREVTALSRGGLEKKAGRAVSETGEQISDFIGNIPKDTTLKVKPIVDAIEETKKGFTVKGVVVEPDKLKVADEILDIVKQFGDELEADNIIELRRIWDGTIAKAGKGFGLAEKDTFKLEVKKTATNKIRDELGTKFPDLDVLNKEFSFWKGVKDTVAETTRRTQGKTSFQANQAGRLGATGGFIKGGVEDAIYIGIAAKNLTKLFSSTAWRTMSAKKKMQLARLMESGDVFAVSEFARRGAAGVKNSTDEE